MSLISALVQELLKIFVGGGGQKAPSGGIGLIRMFVYVLQSRESSWGFPSTL